MDVPDHVKKIIDWAQRQGLAVSLTRHGQSHRIRAQAASPHVVEVDIPHGCYEWYVSVIDKDTGQECHSDWTDHYAVSNESDEELQSERVEGIIRLLDAIPRSKLRFVEWEARKLFGFIRLKPFREMELAEDGGENWVDMWHVVFPDDVPPAGFRGDGKSTA